MRVLASLNCEGYLNIDHIGFYTGVIPIDTRNQLKFSKVVLRGFLVFEHGY